MARKPDLAAQLAELAVISQDPSSAESVARLQTALAGRSNHLVARAARMVGEHELVELAPALVAAFDRFMIKPLKSDPGCAAKNAIIEALRQLNRDEEERFLLAIHHRQMEPVYGGRVDTAAGLRVGAALALLETGYPRLMVELADLLADPESEARIGAARTIGYTVPEAGLPLLRFKVLVGDQDTRVLYECFVALLKLDPEPSIPFVANNISSDDPAVAEAAALALGESRLTGAFPLLLALWREAEELSVSRALLLALALLRHEPAIEFLISLVADAPFHQAAGSLLALDMYRYDEIWWRQVEEAVARRGDHRLSKILAGD